MNAWAKERIHSRIDQSPGGNACARKNSVTVSDDYVRPQESCHAIHPIRSASRVSEGPFRLPPRLRPLVVPSSALGLDALAAPSNRITYG